MLSAQDNALLNASGPGTVMGEYLRRYWHPVALSEEVPEADCTPVRVRVLGEDWVLFRDSAGRTGLLDPACAHRGANLFYGRNEEGGCAASITAGNLPLTALASICPMYRRARRYTARCVSGPVPPQSLPAWSGPIWAPRARVR